jgi:energy-coupling factor transporter transmembrane protein EcfT
MSHKMKFRIKILSFYTFTLLTLITQIGLSIWLFIVMNAVGVGFWQKWIGSVLVSLISFGALLFLAVILTGNTRNQGPGDWYFTLFNRFKKVYHSNLGYFIIYLDEYGVDLYKIGWFRLIHLDKFTLNPTNLQKEIKDFLDREYQEVLKNQKEKETIYSRIKEVQDWDGFLDKSESRDEKINKIIR